MAAAEPAERQFCTVSDAVVGLPLKPRATMKSGMSAAMGTRDRGGTQLDASRLPAAPRTSGRRPDERRTSQGDVAPRSHGSRSRGCRSDLDIDIAVTDEGFDGFAARWLSGCPNGGRWAARGRVRKSGRGHAPAARPERRRRPATAGPGQGPAGRLRPGRPADAAVQPARRLHPAPVAVERRRPEEVLRQGRLVVARRVGEIVRAVPKGVLGGSDRQAARGQPCRRTPGRAVLYDTPKWIGYEVVLDVHPDVFAYGILLLPKDLKAGREAAGRRLPARAGRAAAGRLQPQGADQVLQLVRRPARRPRLHRVRPAEPVHRREQVPRPPAEGQPAQAVAVRVHRPPARA